MLRQTKQVANANFAFSNSGRVKDKYAVEVKYASGSNSLSAEAFEQRLIAHLIEKLRSEPQPVKIDFASKEVKLELQKQSKSVIKQFLDDVTKSYDRLFTV